MIRTECPLCRNVDCTCNSFEKALRSMATVGYQADLKAVHALSTVIFTLANREGWNVSERLKKEIAAAWERFAETGRAP
jgi:hypothetical protein